MSQKRSASAIVRIASTAVAVGLLAGFVPILSTSSALTAAHPHVRLMSSRLASPATSFGYGSVPAMRIDMLSATHGFGLNSTPAMNDGNFPAAPSVLLSTADAGQSWRSRAFPPGDGVYAISFTSPTVGWAAVFRSVGATQTAAILHTTNAGATWTAQPLPPGTSSSIIFDIDFADSTHGWAVGTNRSASGPMILATSDGGLSWTAQLLPVLPSYGEVDSISFSNDQVGWAIGRSSAGSFVLSSINGGSNWVVQPVPSGVRQLLAVHAVGGDAWAVGTNGPPFGGTTTGVAISTQGGGPWTTQSTPATLGLGGVSFSSTSDGWATGLDTSGGAVVLHTQDGGATWTSTTTPAATSPAAVAAVAGVGAWVIGGGQCFNSALIGRTTDSGVSWQTQLAMAGTTAQLRGLAFPTPRDGWTISSNCGYHLLHTTNGGGTWTPAPPLATAFQATSLAFPDQQHGWVVGDNIAGFSVQATTNGGTSWTQQSLPSGFQPSLPLAFGDTHNGWILGSDASFNSAIAGTADGGGHWSLETLPSAVSLSGVGAFGPSDVWAVGHASDGSGLVIASTNGGASWATQPVPSGIGTLYDVSFVDSSRGWAVGDDMTGNAAILATQNGGATWTRQTNVPQAAGVAQVTFASASVGWALAGMQLLATTDGGASWAAQALPSFLPIADGLRATNATTLLLVGSTATEVPEIARSSTGGSTWGKAHYFDPAWVSETPTSGAAGSTVTLTGYGFDNGEAVSIRWATPNGLQVALTTADSSGSFAVPFTVPAATAGSYGVYALGHLSLSAPSIAFKVT